MCTDSGYKHAECLLPDKRLSFHFFIQRVWALSRLLLSQRILTVTDLSPGTHPSRKQTAGHVPGISKTFRELPLILARKISLAELKKPDGPNTTATDEDRGLTWFKRDCLL